MKKINKILLTLFSLTSASMLYAANNKVTVDVQIDPDYQSKNIIFVTSDKPAPSEAIGVHRKGGPTMIHSKIDPIGTKDYYPQVWIIAYVTDYVTNTTTGYGTKTPYFFKPGTHLAVNFPVMFEPI
jgi:hypothetical protein